VREAHRRSDSFPATTKKMLATTAKRSQAYLSD